MTIPILGIFLPVWAIILIVLLLVSILWKTELVEVLIILVILYLVLKFFGLVG